MRKRNHEQVQNLMKDFRGKCFRMMMYLAKDFNVRFRVVPKVEEPERKRETTINISNVYWLYEAKKTLKSKKGPSKKPVPKSVSSEACWALLSLSTARLKQAQFAYSVKRVTVAEESISMNRGRRSRCKKILRTGPSLRYSCKETKSFLSSNFYLRHLSVCVKFNRIMMVIITPLVFTSIFPITLLSNLSKKLNFEWKVRSFLRYVNKTKHEFIEKIL